MTEPTQSATGTVRVKICGITRPEDAVAAEQAGADAIGMIFAPSKRRVDLQAAGEIVASLGPFVTTVGVFKDAAVDEVMETLERFGLDVAQLHGEVSEEDAAVVRRRFGLIRAAAFADAPEPADLAGYPADAYHIDGPKPGSGERYDWRAILSWRAHPRLVLAGGLRPGNVAEAVRLLRPYGVDVASGVELTTGVKDHDLIRRFVQEARAA